MKNRKHPLPAVGLVRLRDIIGYPEKGKPGAIPVSRITWWRGVRDGNFPPAIQLSKKCNAWRAQDIHRLIETGDWRPKNPNLKVQGGAE